MQISIQAQVDISTVIHKACPLEAKLNKIKFILILYKNIIIKIIKLKIK